MPHGSPEKQFLYHAFSFEKFKIKPFKHIVKLTKSLKFQDLTTHSTIYFKKKFLNNPKNLSGVMI